MTDLSMASSRNFTASDVDDNSSTLSSNMEEAKTCSASSFTDAENASTAKTVLVTGGAGFIGSHTAAALLKRGDHVVVVDEMNDYYDPRLKEANLDLLREIALEVSNGDQEEASQRFVFAKGDVADIGFMSKVFAENHPTHVCHLAARAGVRPSIDNPYIYVHSNVMGTVNLMELASNYGCANFVYASSSSVYGGSQNERFAESDIVDFPVSQYAATKKCCELFASTYHNLYGLNCTGLRFFTVYGPRGRPDMAPLKFIHRVMNGITIDQYGNGTSERDYTYVDDIVAGVVLSIDHPLGNEVLNLGRGSPCNLSDFISTVEDLCGTTAKINIMPMQPGDVPRTCADTTKAKNLLGYEAKVPLREGLQRTVEWYRNWSEKTRSLEETPVNVRPQT